MTYLLGILFIIYVGVIFAAIIDSRIAHGKFYQGELWELICEWSVWPYSAIIASFIIIKMNIEDTIKDKTNR